ncbi:MAG: hypothetical protein BHV96_05595 [Clostridium sp. CAG:354_28_25]|jgi:hypothetical protein|nr:MAG: hypothetical protein BHV96_05595 [Clostridium sp. CAG:354_28_25]
MARSVTVKFNNKSYNATYNEATDEYEVELTAPITGGIYNAQISCVDAETTNTTDIDIRILKQEQIKITTDDTYMYIFDYKDFSVKDVVELSNYEINIDEETNANTTVNVLKKTTAKANDIVMIKENADIKYWGIIQEIQNENGSKLYQYTIKYITNMFNQNVILNQNIVTTNEIEEGYYRIHSKLNYDFVFDVLNASLEAGANLQIYESNNTMAQKFRISKRPDGTYKIVNINSGMAVDVQGAVFENGTNVQVWTDTDNQAQKWIFTKRDYNSYSIYSAGTNQVIDLKEGNITNGGNLQIWEYTEGDQKLWILEKLDEEIIRYQGIEDYIAEQINKNFINNEDTLMNREYLEVRVKTHTKLNVSVSTIVDVQNDIYNLHTFMTNCTQNYNITYNVFLENKKLIIEIENKEIKKELIDVNAQPISNYTEVFETDVVSKVVVITKDGSRYTLYLKTDRTTTENMLDENRAEGKTEVVYAENIEDAKQKALDTFKGNAYNHNVTFDYYDREIKVGTPITIKTKESLIYDTYISAVTKQKGSKFYKYTCGNIRISFIDKLKKERKK